MKVSVLIPCARRKNKIFYRFNFITEILNLYTIIFILDVLKVRDTSYFLLSSLAAELFPNIILSGIFCVLANFQKEPRFCSVGEAWNYKLIIDDIRDV